MTHKHRPRGRRVAPIVVPIAESLAQQTLDRDKAYFEAHPDASEYLRPYVPGEITDEHGVEHVPTNNMVRVIHIGGPLRLRIRGDIDLTPDMQADIANLRKKVQEDL